MLTTLSRIIYKLHGWKVEGYVPPEVNKCVLVSGPHTSNWDTYFAVAAMHSLNIPMKVAIKKFWVQFPQSLIIKPIGGIGVDTNNKKFSRGLGQIQMMAELFEKREKIALMISPEGNRSLTKKWKLGFYMIAKMANVPIVLAYVDYKTKTSGFGPVFTDLSDKNKIMEAIVEFYESKTPCYPENFAGDSRFTKLPT